MSVTVVRTSLLTVPVKMIDVAVELVWIHYFIILLYHSFQCYLAITKCF